jgi:hypothetical protein
MPVMDYTETTQEMQRTRGPSLAQTNRMGAQKRNRYALVLECRSCGTTRSKMPGDSGDECVRSCVRRPPSQSFSPAQ